MCQREQRWLGRGGLVAPGVLFGDREQASLSKRGKRRERENERKRERETMRENERERERKRRREREKD